MAFPTDDILLGPASFGGLHRLDMLIGHTGEEPGFSRDYAVKTTIWQRTNPGSYSFRIYDAASAGSKGGVLLTVPYLVASGGINPSSAYWAPERFPFLERELAKAGSCPFSGCPGPYRNPTMHAGQISFTGRTDQLAAHAPANYVRDAERLIAWYDGLAIRGSAPLVLVMHGHWQRNRSDWGAWMQAQLTEEEGPMADIDTFALEQIRIDGSANIRAAPADDADVLFKTGSPSSAVSVGTKNGYHVYWIEAHKRWGYTSTNANVLSRQPYEPIVGVAQTEYDAALAQISALSIRIRLKDEHNANYPKG